MDILPFMFRTCQICGVWYENNKFLVFKLAYRIIVLFFILQFTFSQIVQLVIMRSELSKLTEVLFLTFTFVALCLKIINFIARQNEIIELVNDFRSSFCQSKSLKESKIIQRFSKCAANIFLAIMSLSQLTGLVLLIIPFLSSENNNIQLPFKSYQPYNISNTINFWITYICQVAAAIYGVLLNVSMDTMVYGFIIMAIGQLEINCHRLIYSTSSLKDCIKHHVLIQNIVFKIQCIFTRVIVPLLFFSLITLCTSIFQMSQKEVTSFDFLSLTMYFFCMLFQLFLYCWFGNELHLQSKAVTNAIYSSNWSNYSTREKKSMWFVMVCAQNGLNISFHGQCSLSLSTFLWIVKTSYAAFNLLQRASTEKLN